MRRSVKCIHAVQLCEIVIDLGEDALLCYTDGCRVDERTGMGGPDF